MSGRVPPGARGRPDGPGGGRPLDDLQVVDLTAGIAGPYCTKLFADAGADVVKVEGPEGDPLRHHAASGTVRPGEDGALFHYLNAGKRSITGPYEHLLAGADLLVEDGADLDVSAIRQRYPHLVVASITWYGRSGPLAGQPASDLTIQCDSGAMKFRIPAGRSPVQAGGRISEFLAGTFAASPALAAVLRARAGGPGGHIDLSILEVMVVAGSNYTSLLYDLLDRPPLDTSLQLQDTPGIERAEDGLVAFNTNSGQMLQAFLLMIERPDLMDDPAYASLRERNAMGAAWQQIIDAWVGTHTVAEAIERAGLLRVAVAPVHSGASIVHDEQLSARRTIRPGPGGRLEPGPPYRIDGEHYARSVPAPRLGEHAATARPRAARAAPTGPGDDPGNLPLSGLHVVDLTSWWVGALATQGLAALGADVVHVESTGHPDGMRLTGHAIAGTADWWEWGHMFAAANAGKRGITLDMALDEGRRLLRDLVARADVLVENFAPRVAESWGLDHTAVLELNPRIVYLRMPAFGLTGPWRDRPAFAQTIEPMSGMAWITGHPGDPPTLKGGLPDPIAGAHGTWAALVGLARQRQTSAGAAVESIMLEAVVNVCAQPMLEWAAYGTLMERQGNRSSHAVPQGIYPCGDGELIGISVAGDTQWRRLVHALGIPAWTTDPLLSTAGGRHERHDHIDKGITAWTEARSGEAAAAALRRQGVPAALCRDPRVIADHPQLVARDTFETFEHPVLGRHQVPRVPYRLDGAAVSFGSPAPTLGQHTEEVLAERLDLSSDALAVLARAGVTGSRPATL